MNKPLLKASVPDFDSLPESEDEDWVMRLLSKESKGESQFWAVWEDGDWKKYCLVDVENQIPAIKSNLRPVEFFDERENRYIKGYFHCWNGQAGIIEERAEGQVWVVLPHNIKFLD